MQSASMWWNKGCWFCLFANRLGFAKTRRSMRRWCDDLRKNDQTDGATRKSKLRDIISSGWVPWCTCSVFVVSVCLIGMVVLQRHCFSFRFSFHVAHVAHMCKFVHGLGKVSTSRWGCKNAIVDVCVEEFSIDKQPIWRCHSVHRSCSSFVHRSEPRMAPEFVLVALLDSL